MRRERWFPSAGGSADAGKAAACGICSFFGTIWERILACGARHPKKRVESALLAGEGDKLLALAVGAAQPEEPVGKHPALEEGLKLGAHVLG